ncbi:MAG: hypothetical protein ACREX8_01180, partial [Gammaproteobacteria bacterium]
PYARRRARGVDVHADEPLPIPARKEEPAITRQRRRRHAATPSRPKGQHHRITVTGDPKPNPNLDLIAQALVIIGRHLDTDHARPSHQPDQTPRPL